MSKSSPSTFSQGPKSPAYERPASVQKTAPVDDEAGAPKSPGRQIFGQSAKGVGAGGTKIH